MDLLVNHHCGLPDVPITISQRECQRQVAPGDFSESFLLGRSRRPVAAAGEAGPEQIAGFSLILFRMSTECAFSALIFRMSGTLFRPPTLSSLKEANGHQAIAFDVVFVWLAHVRETNEYDGTDSGHYQL